MIDGAPGGVKATEPRETEHVGRNDVRAVEGLRRDSSLPIAFGIRELHKLRAYRDQDRAELAALAQRAPAVRRVDKTPAGAPGKLRPQVLEPV